MVEAFFPATWDEALKIKQQTAGYIYAGGTDLMVKKKSLAGTLPKFDKPVVFIHTLKEIQEIRKADGWLRIGAASTYDSILRHRDIPEILKHGVREIASPAIRNTGTIGGNICNASPAGDTIPVLYALDAQVVIESMGKSREIPIDEFIIGPGKTLLKEDEIVKEILIPWKPFEVQYYKKVGARRADAISKLSFVGLMHVESQRVEDIRIAFGAVAPTVIRSKEIENQLIGIHLKEIFPLCLTIAELYEEKIRPIDDQRSTAKYRKTVALRILEDFLSVMIS